jgi:hypothetical protein
MDAKDQPFGVSGGAIALRQLNKFSDPFGRQRFDVVLLHVRHRTFCLHMQE